MGDIGGPLTGGGRGTDSHVTLDSVGDVVRMFAGLTLSVDRGCRIATLSVNGAEAGLKYLLALPEGGSSVGGEMRREVKA